jgi:hypothetical protein
VSVVLPESIWALMPMFRTLAISFFIASLPWQARTSAGKSEKKSRLGHPETGSCDPNIVI